MKKLILFIFLFLCACVSERVTDDVRTAPALSTKRSAVTPACRTVAREHPADAAHPQTVPSEANDQTGVGVLAFFILFLAGWWLIKGRNTGAENKENIYKPKRDAAHRLKR